MKKVVFVVFLFAAVTAHAQKPKAGTYTYHIQFAEWHDTTAGPTCTVIIKGDSIKVLNDGTGGLPGKKGDIFDEGVLMQHKATRQWIIAHESKDKNAEQVGGCSGGPSVIDIKRRKIKTC